MFKILVAERRFSALLLGSLLSKVGDGIHELVFILTTLKVTGENMFLTGLVYFFRFIPYLVLGPLGGSLADRLSRSRLMVLADLARMAVTLAFCVLLMLGLATPVTVGVMGFLMTALRTIFQPAFQAAVPALVDAKNLPQVNGASQIATEVGGLVGPALGGLALARLGQPGQVLLADAASYLVSVLCVLAARVPAHAAPSSSAPVTVGSLLADFHANYRGILRNRSLKIAITYSAACILFVGAALRVLIPSLIRQHGLPDSVVGYAMSATAVGTIAGALVCARVLREFGTRRLMLCWAVYGLVLAAFPGFAATLPTIVLAAIALGVAGAFVDVVLPTNIQQLSDDGSIGKNFSFFSTLANTGEALSAVLASGIVIATSVGSGIVLIGAAVAIVGFVGRTRAAPAAGGRAESVTPGVLP